MTKKIRKLAGYLFLACGAAIALIVRLSHPDVAETRLFLDYWFLWLVVLVCNILAMYMLVGSEAME